VYKGFVGYDERGRNIILNNASRSVYLASNKEYNWHAYSNFTKDRECDRKKFLGEIKDGVGCHNLEEPFEGELVKCIAYDYATW